MNNKKHSSFASFICAAYLVTAVIFIVAVGTDITKGKAAAERRFRKLTSATSQSLKENIARSEAFYSEFLKALGNVTDMAGIQVSDQQGPVISYPSDMGEDSDSIPGVIVEPYRKSTKLNDVNGQEVILTAAIYQLKPTDLYDKLRLTFLAILAETLVCMLYLIYVSLYGRTEEPETDAGAELDMADEDDGQDSANRSSSQPVAGERAVSTVQDDIQPATTMMDQDEGQDAYENGGFRNYELTQEEYDGLLSDDIDVGTDEEEEEDDDDDGTSLDIEEQEDENNNEDTIVENDTAVSADDDDKLFDDLDDKDDILDESPEEPSFLPPDDVDGDFAEENAADATEKTFLAEPEKHTDQEKDDDILFSQAEEDEDDELLDDEDLIGNSSTSEEDAAEDFASPTDDTKDAEASPSPAAAETETFDDEPPMPDSLPEEDGPMTATPSDSDASEAVPPSEEDSPMTATPSDSDASEVVPQSDEDGPVSATPSDSDASEAVPPSDEDDSVLEEEKDWSPREIPAIDDSIFDDEDAQDDLEDDEKNDFEIEDEDWLEAEDEKDEDTLVNDKSYSGNLPPDAEEYASEEEDDNEKASPAPKTLDDEPELDPIEEETDSEDKAVTESESALVPAEEQEAVPSEEQETVPAEEQETAPAEEQETAPAEEQETAPAEEQETAPAEEPEAAPSEGPEATPAEGPEAAPAEETETAPAEEPEAASASTDSSREGASASEVSGTPAPAPSGPTGLYSNKTGFGWESYMLPRVDNEILRCTKSNQDISIVSVRIDGLDWTKDEGQAICKSVKELINSPDLIFEKGDDAFTAALPDTDVNEAITMAEDLYSSIDEILAQYGNDAALGIGISSRSLRMVSGERLANEAEVALSHALEDESSPIVAFKVDPQKYRKFLAAQAEQEE